MAFRGVVCVTHRSHQISLDFCCGYSGVIGRGTHDDMGSSCVAFSFDLTKQITTYEIVSRHKRFEEARQAGLVMIVAEIRGLDDREAPTIFPDEHILIGCEDGHIVLAVCSFSRVRKLKLIIIIIYMIYFISLVPQVITHRMSVVFHCAYRFK